MAAADVAVRVVETTARPRGAAARPPRGFRGAGAWSSTSSTGTASTSTAPRTSPGASTPVPPAPSSLPQRRARRRLIPRAPRAHPLSSCGIGPCRRRESRTRRGGAMPNDATASCTCTLVHRWSPWLGRCGLRRRTAGIERKRVPEPQHKRPQVAQGCRHGEPRDQLLYTRQVPRIRRGGIPTQRWSPQPLHLKGQPNKIQRNRVF